jgi:hypothetical protein
VCYNLTIQKKKERVMRRVVFVIPVLVCLFVGSVLADPDTQIRYDIADLGLGRWQYTYEVKNISLPEPISEFTIWFGIGSYDNLAIATLDPPANNWDEIVWQPEPFLGDDGGYDALAKGLNINVGESVTGFSVSFDWMGVGTPSSQFYEIVVPNTSPMQVIDSGWTVPEPGTVVLLGFGAVWARRNLKSRGP